MGAFDTICPPCLQVGATAPSAPPGSAAYDFHHLVSCSRGLGSVVRSALEKPDTLDLYPSSMPEPKFEGLDQYTCVFICISVSGSS